MIFVTTATRFSGGVKEIVASPNLKHHRLELELIDGEQLLELLRVTSPNRELKLPDIIKEQDVWQDQNGLTKTTIELLLAPKP